MKIKYLLKLVSKQEYALDLVSGKFFMHSAKHYHNLELGQGDPREGWITDGIAIYKNYNYPIYCLFAVSEDMIIDNTISLPLSMIHEFHTTHVVIMNFDLFEKKLPSMQTNGYELIGGRVSYGIPSMNTTKAVLTSNDPLNLLIKHPYFSYQHEYRLIVCQSLSSEKCDYAEYCIPQGLQDIADIFAIHELPKDDQNVFLSLTH